MEKKFKVMYFVVYDSRSGFTFQKALRDSGYNLPAYSEKDLFDINSYYQYPEGALNGWIKSVLIVTDNFGYVKILPSISFISNDNDEFIDEFISNANNQ